MKDSMFEMLLHLFEKSLGELQKVQSKTTTDPNEDACDDLFETAEESFLTRIQNPLSMRVYTPIEQIKLSKASQQFLIKMRQLDIIDELEFENVVHQLLFSDSRIASLEETKWAVRDALEPRLNDEEIKFIDLVLNLHNVSTTLQ